MSRRNFVLTSSIALVLVAGVVGGLALYTNYAVKASVAGLPEALTYLPADSSAVFGMNVRKFVASPVYARFEEKHGSDIGEDLADFTVKTGVDPRRDLDYIIATVRGFDGGNKNGALIAVGRFNTAAITTFIETQKNPVRLDYKGFTVLMIPENGGNKIEKGVAYLSESEIALGDLESLKKILDVRTGSEAGISSNAALYALIQGLDPTEMFWFAGEASRIVEKAPARHALRESLSAIKEVVGTLNLSDAVTGRILATAKDEDSARKLADIARGLVALGQLAGDKDPDIAELMRGVSVIQERNQIRLQVNFPIDILYKLD